MHLKLGTRTLAQVGAGGVYMIGVTPGDASRVIQLVHYVRAKAQDSFDRGGFQQTVSFRVWSQYETAVAAERAAQVLAARLALYNGLVGVEWLDSAGKVMYYPDAKLQGIPAPVVSGVSVILSFNFTFGRAVDGRALVYTQDGVNYILTCTTPEGDTIIPLYEGI